jgi:hypothetical protein
VILFTAPSSDVALEPGRAQENWTIGGPSRNRAPRFGVDRLLRPITAQSNALRASTERPAILRQLLRCVLFVAEPELSCPSRPI